MSVSQIKNSNVALVGIGTSTTPPASSISDLAEGQIGVFPVSGVAGAAIDADAKFVIAVGGSASKPAFVSEAIDPADVVTAKSRGLEVATEQKDSIGYNGTTGSIATLTASNLYMVDVMIQELLTSNTDGRYIKHFQWKSGAAAPTQMDVAYNLVVSGIKNFAREAEDYMQFDIYSAAAGATEAQNIVVANGSKAVTGAGVLTAVVGDFLRFGSVGGGATVADSVYKVIAITAGNVYTLDRKVTAASGTYATATADADVITLAQADGANAGLALTGKALSFVVGKEQYKKVRWELVLRDFGSTASVRESNADAGIGTYEQAAEAEWFSIGGLGEPHRMGEPTIYPANLNAVSGVTYDITSIRFRDTSVVGFQNEVSEKMITIYTPNGADYATDATTDNGLWLQIEAALANVTGKMSHRDTGAASDTAGSLLL